MLHKTQKKFRYNLPYHRQKRKWVLLLVYEENAVVGTSFFAGRNDRSSTFMLLIFLKAEYI